MKTEFVNQLNEIFIMYPKLKDEYFDLYDFVRTLKEAKRLQEEILEVNNKLSELNQEKEEK